MALDPALRTRLEETIAKDRVVLFMKGNKTFPQCGFSSTVVAILKDVGVPFETVNVLTEPGVREGIKELSQWATIPQLYVDKKFVGGCDIVRELHQTGELHALLGVERKKASSPAGPPAITVTARAAEAFREAGGDDVDVLRFAVSAQFESELFFGPKAAGDVVVSSAGVTLHLDPKSAARANGVSIDFVSSSEGAGFKIENPNAPPRVRELTARELHSMLAAKETFTLVDVRTEAEHETAKIEGARLLDAAFAAELEAGPRDARLVFQCHHGIRSQAAAERFLERGFTNVWNLAGGIDAYSAVDPSVPRY